MKVSGSHVEKIESMSQNLFRIKEEQTIQMTTEKLSKEGKHVINIIHGTPSSIMGTVTKTLTFLWEADDEDPAYKATKSKERQINILKSDINCCKYEISSLKERINAANKVFGTLEDAIKNEKYKLKKAADNEPIIMFCCSIVFFILSLVFYYLFEETVSFFGVITALGGVFAFIFSCFSLYKRKTSPKKTSVDIYRVDEKYFKDFENRMRHVYDDKANLSDLKKRLSEKEEKLAKKEAELAQLERKKY